MNTESQVDPTLLTLSGDTTRALRESRYEEAITLGRRALAGFELDPDADPDATTDRLNALTPPALEGAGDVLTALAISSFRSGDYLHALKFSQLEHQVRRHA